MADYFDKSAELINLIVKGILKTAPQGWKKVEFSISYGEGVDEYTAKAQIDDQMQSFPVSGITPSVREFKELNSSEEKGTLKGLLGTVTPDGEFKLDYKY